MQESVDEIESLGVSLVGISADEREDTVSYAKKERIGFPLLDGSDLTTIEAYGVLDREDEISLPAVFIVDQNKRIRWQFVGSNIADRSDLDTMIDFLRGMQ